MLEILINLICNTSKATAKEKKLKKSLQKSDVV